MTERKRTGNKSAGREAGRSHGRKKRAPEDRAFSALADLVREARRRLGAGGACNSDVDLALRLRIRAGTPWKIEADPPLSVQVDEVVREAAAREDVFQSGRIYCYRCESSSCPHGRPPAPEKVFTGYSSTGVPLWADFAQLLLARRHPDADRIFDSSQRSLSSLFLEGEELRISQLAVFGRASKTYNILGQVVFGYLRATPPSGNAAERAALTVQAVEVRGGERRPRLVLNMLGQLTDGTETIEALEGWRYDRVFQALSAARRQFVKIRPLSSRAAAVRSGPRTDFGQKASGILKKMAGTLQRIGRQGTRRTDHAEERHRQKRPTAKAVEDAAAARDERLFRDDREHTVVVVGPRGRVHVFSPEGRHITSLTLRREEIDGRLRRRRWQPLEGKSRLQFRSRIAELKQDS